MTPVFADTSAFVALVDRRDKNHAGAKRFLRQLAKKRPALVTSTEVFDEVVTLIRFRVGYGTAVDVGEKLLASSWCRTLEIGEDTRAAA